jgi:hypothetical protein
MRDVLSYFSWISAEKMIGALGLAKTTTWQFIPMTAFATLLTEFAQGELEHALAEQVPSAFRLRLSCAFYENLLRDTSKSIS